MGLGEGDQRVGRLDLALGLGDRLGARADHHRLELRLGRLLLDLGLLQRLLRRRRAVASDTSWRSRGASRDDRRGRLGLLDRHLGLLDRQLVGPPLLGAGERLEQGQRRFEPVARRRLLRQIGLRDRLVELDDRLPFLDRVALRDEQLVDVPLDRGCQGGDVVGEGLATPQPLDGLGQRPQPGRLGPDRDVSLALR